MSTEGLGAGIAATVRQIDELRAEVRQLADENEFLDSALEMNIMHAEKWQQRALEAESSLAERNDSYDHLARNYRQLRADINRMIASHKMAAEYSDNEALRRAYGRIAGELSHVLDRPLEGDKP